jgi:hypothetical protein
LTAVEKRATDGGTLQRRVELKYNVWGLLVEEKADTDGNGSWDITQRFAYDGWNPAKPSPIGTENFDVWADLNGSSSLPISLHFFARRGDFLKRLWLIWWRRLGERRAGPRSWGGPWA